MHGAMVAKTALSTLKKGEGYELELKSGELYELVSDVAALYGAKKTDGIPSFDTTYVKADNPLAQFSTEADGTVRGYVESNPEQALKTFSVITRWLTDQQDRDRALDLLRGLDVDQLEQLAMLSNLEALRAVMIEWKTNRHNGSEQFWQTLLTTNPVLLDFAFPYSVQLIEERAYVGGKKLNNQGGAMADFLLKQSLTKDACILEIKTPTAKLLGSIYRKGAGVYPPSPELAGSGGRTGLGRSA